ncbi:hypothetical protein [Bacillus sp. ISL-39]|uniref:coiled-coil domain-containing protein n=1 Tax=Bacillus sp. ISL-39 TaxID=2819124 RepID=UPI001BE6902B|nr:hypothetical protein [Bacillus sp. ISL-39]MBT2637473.1 hypothetical protein [Bacillus sp. ISL-39]
MNWKKDFKVSALIILLVITAIALLDNARTADSAAKLAEDKNRLEKKVISLEKEIERRSRMTEDLKNENDTLAENLSNLEEEVTASQSSVRYQDFMDAIDVVETYKAVGEFEEVFELIGVDNFTSFGYLDQDYNCPCSINFKYTSLDWSPGVVMNLSEFSIEKGKILLTYLTVEKLESNYQFVLTRSGDFYDKTEKWWIEDIRLIEKEEAPL